MCGNYFFLLSATASASERPTDSTVATLTSKVVKRKVTPYFF